MRRFHVTLVLALSVAFVWPAPALIMVGKGNAPVTDQHWPAGALDVANLKTRVGWYEGPPFGGGQWCFQYRGDVAALNDAIGRFVQVKAPELVIVVHEGPQQSQFLKDEKDPKSDTNVDWEFTVWNAESFHRLYNSPNGFHAAGSPDFRGDVDPPRLDVYVSDGRIDWSRVQVPQGIAGLTVRDERASANGYAAGDGSVVRGTAYDMVTSKPVAGASVTVERQVAQAEAEKGPSIKPGSVPGWEIVAQAVTDADGRFEAKQVPPGQYTVVIRCPGYATRHLGYVSLGKDTLKSFVTKLSPTAELSGTVTDSSGKPIANVTVRADDPVGIDGRGYPMPDHVQAKTDADGHFKLAELPRGHVHLFQFAPGYSPLDILKLYDVPSAEPVKLKVTATGRVHVVVKSQAGKPSQGVSVHIYPEGGEKVGSWGGSANLKEDGTFTFEEVPAGRYFVGLKPSFLGKDPNAKPVTVKAGEVADVELLAH